MPQARPLLALVVDDDEYVHRLVAATLRRLPAETLWAPSGRQALTLVHLRPPDLVILDLALPDADGTDLLRAFRETPATCQVPVVILSGLAGHPAIRSDQAAAFVPKPFRATDLLHVVQRALGLADRSSRRELRPSPARSGAATSS